MANTTKRSCNALGVCQNRVPPCNDCEYCPVCEGECTYGHEDDESPTPIDRIAYWGAVGITVGLTVCIVFGLAGFAFVKLGQVG